MMKDNTNDGNILDVEELIQKDIERIKNNGAKTRRESALRDYYKNPSYCICCSKMIIPGLKQKIHDVKCKKFCNTSCAASYNNSKRSGIQYDNGSIIGKCTDEEFIKAYQLSSSYNELANLIGYSNHVNSQLRKRLKDRVKQLNLKEYSDKKINITNMTKGDLIARRSNWQSWRCEIQQNARETYNNSDKLKKCVVCGYDNTYEVAHINPVSAYDKNALISEINNINNLIALCPNHHWEYDNGVLNLDKYLM